MSRRRVWGRLTRPFRVRVVTFEHTRVRVRSFPPLFEHEWIPSLQDRVSRGGNVWLEPGEHVVYETIELDRASLTGAGLEQSTIVDGRP